MIGDPPMVTIVGHVGPPSSTIIVQPGTTLPVTGVMTRQPR